MTENDWVKKGQLIAVVADARIGFQTRAYAAQAAAARAEAERTAAALGRVRTLYQRGFYAKAALDDAEAAAKAAQGQLAAALAQGNASAELAGQGRQQDGPEADGAGLQQDVAQRAVRAFGVIVDKNQRNPTFRNVFALGVCIAIAPTGATPVPVGAPKTGFIMIESMVSAISANLRAEIDGRPANARSYLERHLPGRLWRQRRRLLRPAPDPAAQPQLVVARAVGAYRQGGFRKVLPEQGPARRKRALLRKAGARSGGGAQA
ncbi:MAG TPA: hypothetical protein VGS12_03755 [Caulobacteraceae bacterium]|nr:hypothetical protein [Caulobacteraceae bacterium]